MTKLKLLGAQRVKALTEILDRKYKDVFNKLTRQKISYDSAARNRAQHNPELKEIYDTVQDAIKVIEDSKDDYLNKLGFSISVSENARSYSTSTKTRDEINKYMNKDIDEKILALKRELEDKKSQLWLVETLEEAQAIVNEEIDDTIEEE